MHIDTGQEHPLLKKLFFYRLLEDYNTLIHPSLNDT